MTVKQLMGAPSAKGNDWKTIDWKKVVSEVKRLQMRIAKAVRMNSWVTLWLHKGLSRVQ